MSNHQKNMEVLTEEIEKLAKENRELKKLASNLTEAATKLSSKETSWVYALEGNRDGVWDWNVVTSEVFFSVRWKEMLGFKENEITANLSEWEKRVHPDDIKTVYTDINRHFSGEVPYYQNEHRVQCKDGSYIWILDRGKIISWTEDGKPLRMVGTHTDVTLRKLAEIENARLVEELKTYIDRIKRLQGLLPICAWCKKIRDDKGYWNSVESYIRDHSDADFTHSICPHCTEKYFKKNF